MNNIDTKLSPDTKVLIFPILMILSAIVMSLLIYKIGFIRLQELRDALAEEKRIETTMQERLVELKEKQSIVEQYSVVSVIVLPEDPPSLQVITQLKALAEEAGLVVGDISSGASADTEEGNIEVEISLSGSLAQTYEYLLRIKNMAPLMSVSSFEIDSVGGAGEIELSIASSYAALPETLQEVDEPIDKITQSDLELLAKINSLRRPDFTVLDPTSDTNRENPFTF